MAKDKNKKNVAEETKQMVETDIEKLNIEQRIDENNMIDESIAELGDLKDEEDIKERKIRDYRECKNKALYFRDVILLTHNKTRREEHILNDSIKKAAQLLEDLKASKITPQDYDKAFEEFAAEQNKKLEASNKKFEEYRKKLRNGYPGYYTNEWELERLGLLKSSNRY
jgi:hypothetical protein